MQNVNIKWLWFLGVLLLLNLGLLLFLILGNGDTRPKQERKPHLENMLNFDASQKKQFEIIFEEHQKIIKDKNDEIKVLKSRLFGKIGTEDENAAKATAKRIGELNAAIDLATRKHFLEIREICNSEQKLLFENFLRDIVSGKRPQHAPMEGDRQQGPPHDGNGPPMDGMPPPPR